MPGSTSKRSAPLTLRTMRLDDLDRIAVWLREPHVAPWYLAGSTVDQEIADLRGAIRGEQPTHPLIVDEEGLPIGWCQWYLCCDYPDHASGVGAEPDDIGIDYAIGEPARVGSGLGTATIAALVAHIRQRHPQAGVIADPQATNLASRRVLEKNGFRLLDERPVPSEPVDAPMAIYRLAPDAP